MAQVIMTARKAKTFAGRSLVVGEEFEASEKYVPFLEKIGWATRAMSVTPAAKRPKGTEQAPAWLYETKAAGSGAESAPGAVAAAAPGADTGAAPGASAAPAAPNVTSTQESDPAKPAATGKK